MPTDAMFKTIGRSETCRKRNPALGAVVDWMLRRTQHQTIEQVLAKATNRQRST